MKYSIVPFEIEEPESNINMPKDEDNDVFERNKPERTRLYTFLSALAQAGVQFICETKYNIETINLF
jgi:hypothetical protein